MIIVESRKEIKVAKRKLKRLLKEYGITLTDLANNEECPFHYNTVKSAFNEDSFYWNQELVNLAEKLIDNKKIGIES